MTPPARPTFLLLGAAKSGTTTLYHQLRHHPGICFSEPKEPLFFELEYEQGLERYMAAHYGHWDGEPAVGEGRVYNLFLPYVPDRIHAVAPGARLVVILRDPVQRAHSHWWHRVSRGFERRSFAQVAEREVERLERGERFEAQGSEAAWRENFLPGTQGVRTADLRDVPVVEMGHYTRQLERYLERFGADALKIVLLDDVRRDGSAVRRRILEHLGVDPAWEPRRADARNTARERVKRPWAFRLERLAWSTGMHRLIPKSVRLAALRLVGSAKQSRPDVDPATAELLARHYRPWDEALSQLLGRPLPWREP